MSVSAAAPNKHLNRVAEGCEFIAMGALVLVAIVQLWQVLARYVFNQSLAFSEPLSALLISTLLSFSAASAVHQARHFRFSWLLEQLPVRGKSMVERAIKVLIALVCLMLAIKSALLAWDGIGIKQAGIAMPIGSVYLPMSLAMFIACLFALARVFARHQDPM